MSCWLVRVSRIGISPDLEGCTAPLFAFCNTARCPASQQSARAARLSSSHPLQPPSPRIQGSTASLVAGGGAGALVLALEALGRGGKNASIAQAVLAAAVAFSMAQRFAASGKVMPAGMVAVISAIALLG
jgi:hypothetical protein